MTTCDEYSDAIQELVDGTLSGTLRQELEAHLTRCPSCAALVEELLVVRRASRGLPAMAAPERVWDRLAPIVSARATAPAPRFVWRERVVVPLAVAAVILAAVLITLVMRRLPDEGRPQEETATASPPASNAAAEADLGSLEAELRQAETHYENAIQKLEALAQDQQTLDPQVATDLRKNLIVIDQAIGESRAALRVQPANERAQESLFEAFRSKITLLQDTLALINEMRKGNQDEAARIVAGLSKS
jgi:anti-sigma factor RsiW